MKTELLSLTLAELTVLVQSLGFPAFRAKQLIKYISGNANSANVNANVNAKDFPDNSPDNFSHMTLLPAAMRDRLAGECLANTVSIHREYASNDGGVKYLYKLADGGIIEGVRMSYRYGDTLCVSTQVGCRMNCAFCASALAGLERNLSAGEMAGQIACQTRPVNNVVLMGSGEPFDNYDEVTRFLRVIHEPLGMNIGMRRVSLSTCGLVDKIMRFADEELRVTLCVSLHAPNDALRRELMPVAKANPLQDIMKACRHYFERSGRRLIFEYALINGVNDTDPLAAQLAALLRGLACHVNLIPLNSVKERGLIGSPRERVRAFHARLSELGISTTIRRSLADDVAGACGQLRISSLTQEQDSTLN